MSRLGFILYFDLSLFKPNNFLAAYIRRLGG
jgi:hypothetical protein